jgi:adenylate cyclase
MDGSAERQALVERVRLRFGWAIVAANFAGGLVVFVLLSVVLPAPSIRHPDTAQLLSALVFVGFAAVAFPAVWIWSARRFGATLGWVEGGRNPTERERDLALALPLRAQGPVAWAWALSAIVFGALTAPFSLELAGNVAITVVLGGLVTCALGYLLGERLLRPITALALAGGPPPHPQLPGVAARALLSWTLGTGVVLLGLALLGIGGLHEKRFTVHNLSVAVLVLSVIGIVVGLATMMTLARSLADPIESLRRAVGSVEQGDLDVEVPVDDASEVGLLQAGFNRMVAGLRERERLRDLFGRQVGEDVVRHALDHGVKLGGEAREAAVLFVDLEGSTALAETRDPAEVVSLLNEFFAIVVDVVAAHHGWVDKFEGDAALCVFGAPLPDPDAASHALAAARELGERLAASLGAVKAGIGVCAGRVVAGNIGAAKRFEYTVIGDPVNEAARLTELAKTRPERVLASAAALDRARPDEAEHWRLGDELTLRGRSAPTRIAAPGPAQPPVATGRLGSTIHSLQEPAYRAPE